MVDRIGTIPDAELSVLKLLWQTPRLSARQIVEQLYPGKSASDIGTVHSMLQRLERKGLVARDREKRPHEYFALVTREEVAGCHLESLAGKISDGSMVPFLTHLIRRDAIGPEELRKLRELIDLYESSADLAEPSSRDGARRTKDTRSESHRSRRSSSKGNLR